MKEIKVLELFSGYMGASHALRKANILHKVIGYSDIEDCADYISALNFGTEIPQLGDITKINAEDLEDFDLLTGGFPCTDVSICGLRDLSRGKTILFLEIIRIAKIKKPKFMLLENVQGILSHNHGKTMNMVLKELRDINYIVKWKLMRSKEHGTPQNRPRVWFACFRDKQDADKFMFPEKEPLKITVKDLLEDEVDEKYYLNENQLKKIEDGYYRQTNNDKICNTITTSDTYKRARDMPCIKVADYRYAEGLRLRNDGISPTLCSTQKSGQGISGCPIIRNVQKRSIKRPSIQKAILEGKPLPGGVGVLEKYDGIGYTLGVTPGQIIYTNRWRRLTPRECFRLQGFFNDEIQFGNLSDSKLYFLAGNGWDINVASKIFIQMFKGNQNKQKSVWEF